MAARTGRDQEWRYVDGELRDELAILRRVFARFHIAAAAPGLIADAPILNAEGLPVAIGRAFVGQTFRSRRSIAVRDPIVKLPGRARPDIGREIGFRPDQAAEPDELVNAEVVGLRRMPAGG